MLITFSATSQVIADFTTSTSNSGCGSLVVEFQDLSTGVPISWFWDFGNGNTSNLQNPTAIYSSAGVYDVSLTVTDLNSNITQTENGTLHLSINGLTRGKLRILNIQMIFWK